MKKKYYLYKMNINILNVLSLLITLALIILMCYVYRDRLDLVTEKSIGMLFILMLPYFCLHEIVHSIGYVIMGADFKKITYGAHIEKGVLCCLCKQNISKANILVSLLFPFFWLGIVTLVIGYIFNLYFLVALSIMNIGGCAGDFIMFIALSRLKDYEFSEYDDPISFGLYTKEDLSEKKMFGLDFVGTKTKLERNDLKKITISKASIGYALIFIVIGLLYILFM